MSNMYLCEDCTVVFQLHTKINHRKSVHCPSCGEYFEVVKYKAERVGEDNKKIRWTDEEVKLLMEVKRGKLQAHQVAIQTGRTINSVMKKLGRL